MKPFRIVVLGTRGKSSVVRTIHEYLRGNGYSVLSRETGLFPIVYDDEKRVFLKRDGLFPLSRIMEIPSLMEIYNWDNYDFLVFENNSISLDYMLFFHEAVKPDLAIVVTISLDHLFNQGYRLRDVARTYIDSLPEDVPILFWTNHNKEYSVFKSALGKKKRESKLVTTTFERRDGVVLKSLYEHLLKKGYRLDSPKNEDTPLGLKGEIVANYKGRTIINVGHINDFVHSVSAIDKIIKAGKIRKFYVFLNYRADRPERNLTFSNAFLDLYKGKIKGIIVHSDSIVFDAGYLKRKLQRQYKDLEILTCKNEEQFFKRIEELPTGSEIIWVGNTADEFGYNVIKKTGMFRYTYPILDTI